MTSEYDQRFDERCQWCAKPLRQPDRGRRKQYCDPRCRQNAYKERTERQAVERYIADQRGAA